MDRHADRAFRLDRPARHEEPEAERVLHEAAALPVHAGATPHLLQHLEPLWVGKLGYLPQDPLDFLHHDHRGRAFSAGVEVSQIGGVEGFPPADGSLRVLRRDGRTRRRHQSDAYRCSVPLHRMPRRISHRGRYLMFQLVLMSTGWIVPSNPIAA
jgi:hypothetical protein